MQIITLRLEKQKRGPGTRLGMHGPRLEVGSKWCSKNGDILLGLLLSHWSRLFPANWPTSLQCSCIHSLSGSRSVPAYSLGDWQCKLNVHVTP